LSVVSVDLAYKRFSDIGFCVLADKGPAIDVTFPDVVAIASGGNPTPDRVADRCLDLCEKFGARLLLLDGPQGWKDPENGIVGCRSCERALNTPAKTGLPGNVKPGAYLAFVQFSIEVFDVLAARGWNRLATEQVSDQARQVAIESFPLSAWRKLALPGLRAKAKCRSTEVEEAFRRLNGLFPLSVDRAPNHDELQALVAGLGGIALERGVRTGYTVAGVPPFVMDGQWREGFIANPLRPATETGGRSNR
jgi:hypothetical protein